MSANWGTGNFGVADISMRDYTPPGTGSGEPTHISMYGTVLSAANFAAKVALFDSGAGVVPSIQAITLGLIMSWEYGNLHVSQTVGGATNTAAQRENKLLIKQIDSATQKPFSLTIPTIDLSLVTFQYRDVVDIATGDEMIALVAALNAFCVSPLTGNALTVSSASFVGRRI